ncbi:unnamed protein product [Cladocopium goreaui]|uniref:Uncharacterized protein n=1 Tax=Cladocopium goreaui TaxID=2562237 RepID=A0A9P1C9Z2_9DINO|nr:unnamed protein product [Cladocopium goreaui]
MASVLEIAGPSLLVYLELRDMCSVLVSHHCATRALALPSLLSCTRRLKRSKAAERLRTELRKGVWPEPKKQRRLKDFLESVEILSHSDPVGPARIGPEPLLQAVLVLLNDSCGRVQRAALKLLGDLGDEAVSPECLQSLLKSLLLAAQHADEAVRLEAVEAIQTALCRWWPGCLTEEQQHMLLFALGCALKDSCPHVCAKAMTALSTVSQSSRGLSAQVFTPAADLLEHQDRFVRARACALLGRLRSTPEVTQLLSLRCEDSSSLSELTVMSRNLPQPWLKPSPPVRATRTSSGRDGVRALGAGAEHSGSPEGDMIHEPITARQGDFLEEPVSDPRRRQASPGFDEDGPLRKQATSSSPAPRDIRQAEPLATLEDFEDKEAIKATLGVVNRRQEEWQRQLQSVDEKQAELAHIQWKLIRDQSSSLVKELAIVQTQLKDLKAESRRALVECERAFRDNEAKLNEERGLRLAMFESLEKGMRKVRSDMDVEAQERQAANAEVSQKVKALSEEHNVRLREQQAQDLQQRRLREDLKVALEDLDALKQTVCQELSERREGEETLSELLREVRENLQKEAQNRTAAEEAIKEGFQLSLDQEKADRAAEGNSLRSLLSSLQKELSGLKEANSQQRNKLAEVDHSFNALNARMKELQHSLEDELQKRAESAQRLDQSVKDLQSSIETEVDNRKSLAEEVDHVLKSMKSKVKNLVCEQGELSRQAIETARKQLQEQLDREMKTREAVQGKLQSACEDQRLMLLESNERNESLLRELERRCQEQLTMELKEVEAAQIRLTEETHRQLRDLRESSEERWLEERQAREAQVQGLEDHVDFLEGFLQDARELFLQRGSRQRRSKMSQSPRPLDGLSETPRRLSDTRGGLGAFVND